jgi:hypothetical protein
MDNESDTESEALSELNCLAAGKDDDLTHHMGGPLTRS